MIRTTKLLLLVLLTIFLPTFAYTAEFLDCNRCHDQSLTADSRRFYQHVPYLQQNCAACHKASAPEKMKPRLAATRKQRLERRKVTWLGNSSSFTSEHGFLLPGNKLGAVLVVELQGPNGKHPPKEIKVPLLAELVEVDDTGKPPELSMIEVLEVKRGVFLSVTIGWQTDSLCNARVNYGEDSLVQTSEPSKRLGRRHEVILYDLKPDRTYNYQVSSTDVFGRTQSSTILTFSSSTPSDRSNPVAAGKENEMRIESRFFRLEGNYLVDLQLAAPASVFIGSKGEIRQQNVTSRRVANADSEQGNDSHTGLSGGTLLTIGACRNCHKGQASKSHPVNVLPKPGMEIPPEYPTLPDGRITCASCHFTHSSDYEYLAIRPGKRELCVGCHRDML